MEKSAKVMHFQLAQDKTLKSSETHEKQRCNGTQKLVLCEPALKPRVYFIVLQVYYVCSTFTLSSHMCLEFFLHYLVAWDVVSQSKKK